MDHVVAFILSEILKIVGENSAGGAMELGRHIGRAIGVTFGIGLVVTPITKYLIGPAFIWFKRTRGGKWRAKAGMGGMLFFMTVLFMAMIAATRYAGTSPLYGAYLAGLCVSRLNDLDTYEDQLLVNGQQDAAMTGINPPGADTAPRVTSRDQSDLQPHHPSLIHTFEHYVSQILIWFLLPIFFGSIGYSIPFIPLWRGANIWRGIVYGIFMTAAKAVCGLWLLIWKLPGSEGKFIGGMGNRARQSWKGGLLLGFAMIARGEIGLLIAQIAYSTPDPLLDNDEFLITIWAIVLCTIIGPAGVGYLVKKWGKTVADGGWD